MSDLSRISGGGMALPAGYEFTAAPVAKFQNRNVQPSTAQRLGHAISGAFAKFGRKIANLGSRIADVFHGSSTRLERQYNRSLVAFDRKLNRVVDGLASGQLKGAKLLNAMAGLQQLADRMGELSDRYGGFVVDHSKLVEQRMGALLNELDPAAVKELDTALDKNAKRAGVRNDLDAAHREGYEVLNRLADVFGEEQVQVPNPDDDPMMQRARNDVDTILRAVELRAGASF